MTDRDFQIGERHFKLSKINALKQYHIVRRIAPILGDILPSIKDVAGAMKDQAKLTEQEKFDQIAVMAGPLFSGMAKLSDKDSEIVLFGLLAAVEMKQPETNSWARLVVNDQMMFQDLDLPTMLQAAGRAFMFNMAGFFAVLPRAS
ncbi:hypothetical protein UFOVP558_7 [uncultured Caudovirales phage]|uniref:Uncharacterized protein n=1 Tax=uncultured Caudovirales phage TaxID=2100421 RepID=A0A6J5MX53_9CAUD|nr:hypothetical protein UFOVP558_7 [uncultured Caudovirales phage]